MLVTKDFNRVKWLYFQWRRKTLASGSIVAKFFRNTFFLARVEQHCVYRPHGSKELGKLSRISDARIFILTLSRFPDKLRLGRDFEVVRHASAADHRI